MPHTLTSPPAAVQGTQWLVDSIHVLNMEIGGGVSIRVDLALFAADGITRAPGNSTAAFTVDDNAQFNTDFTNATGTTLVKMRKAAYLAAVRQGVIAAGTGT